MNWKETLRHGFSLSEALRQTPITEEVSLSEFIGLITKAVSEHLQDSPEIESYLKQLPKGSGTSCPDSPLEELIKYVGQQTGNIDKSDPVLTLAFIRDLIMPVFEFEREQVVLGVRHPSFRDITTVEYQMIWIGCELAHAHDILWMKWFEKIVVPYQSLDQAGKTDYIEMVKYTLATYDYTVFDYNPDKGCVDRKPWAVAFPEEINEIADKLEMLKHASNVIHCTEVDPAIVKYLEALRRAYLCIDIGQLESLWTAVDLAWIHISTTCRIIPVHGMESQHEHPFGVSMEFRLMIRTSESRDLIERRRSGVLEHARAMGLDNELLSILSQKLRCVDISVFVTAVRSGVQMNFRFSGQAVPNRQDVLAEGGRIFLDQDAPSKKLKEAIEYIEKHCARDTAIALKKAISLKSILTFILDHEYSHPIALTKVIDEALGTDKILLEESKATLLGIQGDLWSDSSAENRLRCTATIIVRVLGEMNKTNLENDTFAPYVRDNLVTATMLLEIGVITLSNEGVVVNIEKARSDMWYETLKAYNAQLIAAYTTHDRDALHRLVARYCDKSHPDVSRLIAWVNRDLN